MGLMHIGWPLAVPADPRIKPTALYYMAEGERIVSWTVQGDETIIVNNRGATTTYTGLKVRAVTRENKLMDRPSGLWAWAA